MYYMKSIINHTEDIVLPKCMYHVKNPNESLKDEIDEINININKQVMKLIKAPKTKMAELEQRQEQILKKLDILYARIKTISAYCNVSQVNEVKIKPTKTASLNPEEVVLEVNPDNIPYYLNKILLDLSISVNLSWHIHSSVGNEKLDKIKGFAKTLNNIDNSSKVNLRLIFKSVSADSELKLSSLSGPIVGTVNILRYLSLAYPNTIPYDDTDFKVDSLLDICHSLEKTPEKAKEPLFKKLFSESEDWIYKKEFSIVDLATYNIVKQSKNNIKYVPKAWLSKCEKICV